MTNPIREIRDADCVLVAGSNTGEAHPVVSYEVVRAARRGASVIVVDPRRIPLVNHASLHLQPAPGRDLPVFFAMVRAILAEGWADETFIDARTEGLDELRASVEPWTAEAAALVSGVPAGDILRAARTYALGLRREAADAPDPGPRGNSTVLYGMGITQRSSGTEAVKALANLVMVAGHVGRPATGLNPLRGQSNVQGACDVGGLPNVLPGYRPVADPEARRRAAEVWFGGAGPGPAPAFEPPARPGLTVVEMTEAARAGRVKAMVIMGENPMLMDPDLKHVEEGLRALDFLVVMDLFLTETAQLAGVVLPAAAFAEKDGTFTNTERRVQLLRRALDPPGQARPDWWILCRLGERLGERFGRRTRWDYSGTAEIFRELAEVSPIHAGIRHERLGTDGIQWPCPSPDHPGTPVLHTERFARGRGRFFAVGYRPPVEEPDAEYPLALITGRGLFHYHGGSMSRRSQPLDWREPRAYAEVSPADAERAGIRDGGVCLLTSRRGSIRVQARVGERVPEGVVFASFHFREAPANLLTRARELDPEAGMPDLKVCAVRLESPGAGGRPQAPASRSSRSAPA